RRLARGRRAGGAGSTSTRLGASPMQPGGACRRIGGPPRLPSPEPPMNTTKRWTLVVVCAATAMLMLDIAVVNTALSRIAEDLHTGLSGLQWVVDAYTLALATVVLSAGSLADRLRRRKLFTLGLSLFTLS